MAEMTVGCTSTNHVDFGTERYSELSFWIPCYDRKALKEGKLEAALYLPFLFPDGFSPIATGREVLGFSKQLASFTYPGGKLNPFRPYFTSTAVAWKTFPSASAPLAIAALEPAANEGLQEALPHLLTDLELAGKKIIDKSSVATVLKAAFEWNHFTDAESSDPLGGFIDIFNALLDHCPAVFLKQFPSVADASRAEVRSICTAPFQLDKLHYGFPYLGLDFKLKTFQLTFPKLASHPIVERLGLTPSSSNGEANTVPAKGFFLNVDFSLDTGRTVAHVPPPKKKIAVLGGGIGSLAAVYGITQSPGWQEKYDITLYQLGWRLGGKGASGRNREMADRIEEHGLHVWFGYYENAFRLIQSCYRELGRSSNAPLRTWDLAFKPRVHHRRGGVRRRDGRAVPHRVARLVPELPARRAGARHERHQEPAREQSPGAHPRRAPRGVEVARRRRSTRASTPTRASWRKPRRSNRAVPRATTACSAPSKPTWRATPSDCSTPR